MFNPVQLILMAFFGTFSAPLMSIAYNYYLAKDFRASYKSAVIICLFVFIWFFVILKISGGLSLSVLVFFSNVIALILSWLLQRQLFVNNGDSNMKRSTLDVFKVVLIGILTTFLCVLVIKI